MAPEKEMGYLAYEFPESIRWSQLMIVYPLSKALLSIYSFIIQKSEFSRNKNIP